MSQKKKKKNNKKKTVKKQTRTRVQTASSPPVSKPPVQKEQTPKAKPQAEQKQSAKAKLSSQQKQLVQTEKTPEQKQSKLFRNRFTKQQLRKYLIIFSIVLFVGCATFLIYYLILQPHYSRTVNNKYKDLYYSDAVPETTAAKKKKQKKKSETETEPLDVVLDDSFKNNAKDENGILLKFSKLLKYNSDIKGWLRIPGTGMDYPVMQDYNGGDYYLSHDFEGTKDKNGCLYIDAHCDVETPTKNIVIHGHNMDSTGMMFHDLPQYKDINFYKQHPVITFDSIYQNANWKIISFMRLSGEIDKNGGFNYMQGTFYEKEDFLEFLYQIETRSLYRCPVDVNEKDSLLMLSTCSYEFSNCRTVVVARKVRKNESTNVDTTQAYLRQDVLYPGEWYRKYGGSAPHITNFSDALAFSEIDWYSGKATATSPVGQTITTASGDSYLLTSLNTLRYLGNTDKTLTDLTVPSTMELYGHIFDVTELAADAFHGMAQLKTLKIGNLVTSIPAREFTECTALESVIIGDAVTSIGKKAFYQLQHLQKVKIRPLNLTQIDEKAFYKTYETIKFKIPESKFDDYVAMLQTSRIPKRSKFKKFVMPTE